MAEQAPLSLSIYRPENPDMKTVLVAEDDRTARVSLTALVEAAGFRVIAAEDGKTALSLLLHDEPDAALLDIRMPGFDGLEVLRKAREGGSDTAVIIMTAHGDSTAAIEAMKLGAFDYVAKPIDFDTLLPQLRRAIEHRNLARSAAEDGHANNPPTSAPESGMIGHSPLMQDVYKRIGQVAASDATVLVRGESGTGKELVVNAIHHNSTRSRGPLIKVNCASIPETLLESELFGHEKGAFTNAMYRRVGRFEEAHQGTLFLDEIGELALALQAKLLRAVQERTIERLGSNVPIRVDLRLVTATARNLEEAVSEGRFREDLYYRLNVVTITLPALRERRQDIPPLVDFFLHRSGRPVPAILLESLHVPALLSISNTVFRCTIPSFCMRDAKVVRGNPRRDAAPFGPDTTPLDSLRMSRIWLRSTSASVRLFAPVCGDAALSSSIGISTVEPDEQMTARSMTFCSSRTLPGHVWRLRHLSASSAISHTSLFNRDQSVRIKCLVMSGMSSRRSRRGGTRIGNTFNR
jgi:DNA-binding NtrC family response regulator